MKKWAESMNKKKEVTKKPAPTTFSATSTPVASEPAAKPAIGGVGFTTGFTVLDTKEKSPEKEKESAADASLDTSFKKVLAHNCVSHLMRIITYLKCTNYECLFSKFLI